LIRRSRTCSCWQRCSSHISRTDRSIGVGACRSVVMGSGFLVSSDSHSCISSIRSDHFLSFCSKDDDVNSFIY
jgi:hypothetical protein